jgi:hypothetical protein
MEMRRSATPMDQQMNLLLRDATPPGACDQQRELTVELTVALVELLINAAQRSTEIGEEGDENESPEGPGP